MSLSCVSHSIDICTVAVKSIRNLKAVSTNQITTDILYFNENALYAFDKHHSPMQMKVSKDFEYLEYRFKRNKMVLNPKKYEYMMCLGLRSASDGILKYNGAIKNTKKGAIGCNNYR